MFRVAIILASLLIACSSTFTPTQGTTYDRGYYVPRDLEDALRELERSCSWRMKREIRKRPEDEFAGLAHMGIGLFIRNYWLRPKTSRLRASLTSIGLHSLDNMSGTIIRSFHRRLNGKEINLNQQIAYHDAYREAVKPPPPYYCTGDAPAIQNERFIYLEFELPRVVHVGSCPDGSKVYFEHGRGWSNLNPIP